MSDAAKKLRDAYRFSDPIELDLSIYEAADEIERLTAENEAHKKTIASLRVYRDKLAEIIDAMVASGRQAE